MNCGRMDWWRLRHFMWATVVLRGPHAHASHFGIATFEDALVFGVGCRCFLAVAAREAGVDFVVESTSDGFSDSLCVVSVAAQAL